MRNQITAVGEGTKPSAQIIPRISSIQAVVCYRIAAYQDTPYLSAALLPMCAFDQRRVDSVRQKGR